MLDGGLVEELRDLEKRGDLGGGLRRLASCNLSAEGLVEVAGQLYRRNLNALPFLMSRQLLEAGHGSWLLHAICAHLAIRLNRIDDANAQIGALAQALDASDDRSRAMARNLLDPVVPRDAIEAFNGGRLSDVRNLARLWRAVEPAVMARYDLPLSDRERDYTALLENAATSRLLEYRTPAPDAPRRSRKVVLATRKHWWPGVAGTREHDFPVRLSAAVSMYGWIPIHYHLRSFDDLAVITDDYRRVSSLCQSDEVDAVIIDECLAIRGGNSTPGEILMDLRRKRPDLKIVAFYPDPWIAAQQAGIEAAAQVLDLAWTSVVTPLLQSATFSGKTLFTPLPLGCGRMTPAPLSAELNFIGAVQYGNWYRAFWLTAIADAGLPLKTKVSDHLQDGLTVLESFQAYLRSLASAGVVVNFAQRANGSTTLTNRTFEVPAAGALLVQEHAENIDLFLTPGRHYLPFRTLTDLADIAHLLAHRPEIAENIRQAGTAFFHERFADEKIMAYLDYSLFHQSARG